MTSMDLNTNTADQLAVAETCTAMGWYADRHQWQHLIAPFADEVLVDYASLNGGDPVRIRPSDLVAGWRQVFEGLVATQHLMATLLITVDRDVASTVANFQATHVAEVGGEVAIWTLGGHYRFSLIRQPDGWRIAEVTMTAVWETGSRDVLAAPGGPR
jgi:SnoaL-like domain